MIFYIAAVTMEEALDEGRFYEKHDTIEDCLDQIKAEELYGCFVFKIQVDKIS